MDPTIRRYYRILPAPSASSSSFRASFSSTGRPWRGDAQSFPTARSSQPTIKSHPVPVTESGKPESSGEGVSDFVQRLTQILQNPAYNHIVSWAPHGDRFTIHDVNTFTRTVLSQTYKHSNFSSFVRQLNKYDFHKVKVSEGAVDNDNSATYMNPEYRIDRLDALDRIKRKVTVPRKSYASALTGSTSAVSSTGELSPTGAESVDVSNMHNQLEDIQTAQEEMSVEIRTLEQKYHDVLLELVGIQRNMAQQDSLTQSLIRFFVQQVSPPPPPPAGHLTLDMNASFVQLPPDNSTGRWTDLPASQYLAGSSSGSFYDPSRPLDLHQRIGELERTRTQMHLMMQGPRPSYTMEGEEVVMPTVPAPQTGNQVPMWVTPPRILVVEDDEVSRRVLGKFLDGFQCNTDVAVDGMEAVAKTNAGSYDLILMDIVMPKLDGVAATTLIRRHKGTMPIICMTSNLQPADIMSYYSSGITDVLPKPFNKEALLTMLLKHLSNGDQLEGRNQEVSEGSGGFTPR